MKQTRFLSKCIKVANPLITICNISFESCK